MRESALAILFYAVVLLILAALVAEVLSHGDPDTAREPEADDEPAVACGKPATAASRRHASGQG